MIRKVFHSCVLQMLLLSVLAAACLFALPRLMGEGDPVHLYDARVLSISEDGRAELAVYGGNMFRVNTLYLDDKQIRDAKARTISYEECRFDVDAAALEGVSRIRVAKRIALFAEIRSYAMTVDLTSGEGD